MKAAEFNQEVASLRGTLELFTKRFTQDQEESEDLIQDTMLKALTYHAKFKQDTNLKGWLYTIMRNTFINNYRKVQKSRTILDNTKELYFLNVADNHTFNTPDGNYEYNDVLERINKIKEVYLVPFKMYAEGYKYQEIADELNVPIGTVKNRIFHARKEIQNRLTDYK